MLHLTRKADYAIRGMVYLAMQPGRSLSSLGEIAADVDVSLTLLAKIFQQLGRHGLVSSSRGTSGGFLLGRAPEKITLLEIVEAVEGPIIMNRCLVDQGSCNRDGFCTVHPVWKEVQDKMKDILSHVTLKDLAGK
jgi:Rrf2 family iron-sulfur cluster assembly transcriptional regulator